MALRFLAAGILAVAVFASAGIAAEPPADRSGAQAVGMAGCWEALPLPSARERIADAAVDTLGTLWVRFSAGTVQFWDGARFHAPGAEEPPKGEWKRILGGVDRGAFGITEEPDRKRQKTVVRLYELLGGGMSRAAQFECPFDASTAYTPYVACSGKVYFIHKGGKVGIVTGRTLREVDLGEVNFPNASAYSLIDSRDAVHLLCGRVLYSLNAKDELLQRNVPIPRPDPRRGPASVVGYALGNDKLIVSCDYGTSLYLFNLGDLSPVADHGLSAMDDAISQASFRPMEDGSVWKFQRSAVGATTLRVTPDGKVAVLPGLRDPAWQISPTLAASDGSVWFWRNDGRIHRYRDGRDRTYDWRAGFLAPSAARTIQEGTGGVIYAATDSALLAFHPGREPAPLSPELERWAAYSALRPLCQDGQGNIWVFRDDHPGECSRWDGREWFHVKLPAAPQAPSGKPLAFSSPMGDERGHAIASVETGTGELYLDIGPGGVKSYTTPQALLQAVSAGGADVMRGVDLTARAVAAPDGRIWMPLTYTVNPDGSVSYPANCWTGNEWKEVVTSFRPPELARSERWGCLVRALAPEKGKVASATAIQFFALVDGEPKAVASANDDGPVWMFGPDGIQPLEPEMIRREPDRYLPVERKAGPSFRLVAPATGTLPGPAERAGMGAGRAGGYWIRRAGSGLTLTRLLGSKSLAFDYTGTPLTAASLMYVLEDRAGNLWLQLPSNAVFVRRVGAFTVNPVDPPAQAAGAVKLKFAIACPGYAAADCRLFWRFKPDVRANVEASYLRAPASAWQGGEKGDTVEIAFPLVPGADGDKQGPPEVEVIAMDPLGATTPQPAVIRISSARMKPLMNADERR